MEMLQYQLDLTNRLYNLSCEMSSLSLWSSEGIPQVGKIISRSILLTAVALWHRNASIQGENIQIATNTYLYPWERGNWRNSICQTSKELKGGGNVPQRYEWNFQGCALGRFVIFGIAGKLSFEMAFSNIVFPIKPFYQCSSEWSCVHIVTYDVVCNQGEVASRLGLLISFL